jgi:MFS family permease
VAGNAAVTQALYVGLLVLLPRKAQAIAGAHGKYLVLAAVSGSGAAVAIVAGICAGLLSDLLAKRRGSRKIVLRVGAVIAAGSFAALPSGTTLPAFLGLWCGFQLGLNGVWSVVSTSMIDWVEPRHRAVASAFAGLGQVSGVVIASGLAFGLGTHIAVLAPICGGLLLAGALSATGPVSAAAARRYSPSLSVPPAADPVAAPAPSPPEQASQRAPPAAPLTQLAPPPSEQSRARRYRDARFAWGIRAVMTFSNTLVIGFASYYASDALHVASPQRLIALAAVTLALFIVVGAAVSGRASDRSGLLRRYVLRGIAVLAVGELLLALLNSEVGILLACAVVGLGYGTYLAVDLALTADVLPDPATYGRDFGIMNTSTNAPQVIAPAFGALLLHSTASYPLLFGLGAAITLAGSTLLIPIRSVR